MFKKKLYNNNYIAFIAVFIDQLRAFLHKYSCQLVTAWHIYEGDAVTQSTSEFDATMLHINAIKCYWKHSTNKRRCNADVIVVLISASNRLNAYRYLLSVPPIQLRPHIKAQSVSTLLIA